MILIWAVPYSSAAPHVAHLLPDTSRDYTHRLCRPTSVVNRGLLLVVDSVDYRPKCAACQRERTRMSEAHVVFTILTLRPVIRTSSGVTAEWRRQGEIR
jgi:hypothetical protein